MALSTATVTLVNQAAESKVIPKDDVKWIRRRRSQEMYTKSSIESSPSSTSDFFPKAR
ncbi:hypothetical protein YC2023_014741 [Brassica napus]